jgi:putative hydrolase of the HAD superfamily
MRQISGIIFDYGSTLIHFDAEVEKVRPLAYRALAEALRTEGLHMEADPFLRSFHADLEENEERRNRDHREVPTDEILAGTLRRTGWPNASQDLIERVLRRYYEEYEKHWRLYPETHAVLRDLRARGLRLGMLTNAADAANIHAMLERHALAEYFQPVVISGVARFRKPEAKLFHSILDAWQIPAHSVVMVGDQLGMDILGANGVGMRSIWLRTEEHAPANRIHRGKIFPDAEAETVAEVPAILRQWEGAGS